jgi:hypothetical protein
MKAPGKHNRATAAHIPDGISERDGFAGQVHREFFVQSSKIASWPPSTPSTGRPSSTLGGTNSMRRFEFRRTGFPRDESWLRSFRRFFLARGDATELFKIAEEVFDEMTPFVHVETEIWRARPAFGGMSALAPRRSSSARANHCRRPCRRAERRMRFPRSMVRPRRCRGAGRAEERGVRDCRAPRPLRRSWWSGHLATGQWPDFESRCHVGGPGRSCRR